jgi:energy-coupling factor transport system permease protein
VNVSPRFLGRGSWLARRDPRVLVIVIVGFSLAMIQLWDIRFVIPMVALAFFYYSRAGIRFADVRRNWIGAIILITFIVTLNSILTGDRLRDMGITDVHQYFKIPVLGTVVSAESLTYAAAQWLRYLSMVTVGFPLAFCMAPSDFGVTFAKLGIPEKFAFGVDLTFRFVPSLAADFQETIDAQKIRGYEPGHGGSPIARLRRIAPVLTPLTIGAIAGAEDTIDAMDMRAFGTGKRTWLRHLAFDPTDRAVVAFFLGLALVITILNVTTTVGKVWVPPFMLPAG